MHKSRLGAVIIDSRTDDLDADAEFWARALGRKARRFPDPANAGYVELVGDGDALPMEVQKVDHPSRVHIDIETDDVEAEVRRLEALGAKRIGMVKTWCVMQAPGGQRFCVVRPQRESFDQGAHRWP